MRTNSRRATRAVPAHYARAYAWHRAAYPDKADQEADALLAHRAARSLFQRAEGPDPARERPSQGVARAAAHRGRAIGQRAADPRAARPCAARHRRPEEFRRGRAGAQGLGRRRIARIRSPGMRSAPSMRSRATRRMPRSPPPSAMRWTATTGSPRQNAELAMRGIPEGTPDYLRAEDIAVSSRNNLDDEGQAQMMNRHGRMSPAVSARRRSARSSRCWRRGGLDRAAPRPGGDRRDRAQLSSSIIPRSSPRRWTGCSDKQTGRLIDANRAAIETPFAGAIGGNPKGDVTLVEYFDYACGYCRADASATSTSWSPADPGVRIVYKELPILSPWSDQAPRKLSLAAAKAGKFAAFHHALYAAGPLDARQGGAGGRGQAGVDRRRAPTAPAIAARSRPTSRPRARCGFRARRPSSSATSCSRRGRLQALKDAVDKARAAKKADGPLARLHVTRMAVQAAGVRQRLPPAKNAARLATSIPAIFCTASCVAPAVCGVSTVLGTSAQRDRAGSARSRTRRAPRRRACRPSAPRSPRPRRPADRARR